MTTAHTRHSPDHASVKSTGMVVCDPKGRIGMIIGTRYTGDARICQVMFRSGTPAVDWFPATDLVPATENAASRAGYEAIPRTRKKAVRW